MIMKIIYFLILFCFVHYSQASQDFDKQIQNSPISIIQLLREYGTLNREEQEERLQELDQRLQIINSKKNK